MNRKKMIELIVYILIVIAGIVLLMTNQLKDKEKIHDLHFGGVKNAVISVQQWEK
ncbi:hypothetical protein [Desnuesiella massiliensis]|jgi:hypothetical protein|uniref:hypothetical protein n=1 Tax=Desnuesiella massiliensis TaxID=1650662 RepID=UPI0018A7FCF2|nr:hypothetical protein [Desnuesiella massiliensis]